MVEEDDCVVGNDRCGLHSVGCIDLVATSFGLHESEAGRIYYVLWLRYCGVGSTLLAQIECTGCATGYADEHSDPATQCELCTEGKYAA